jgi:hypothetical protein
MLGKEPAAEPAFTGGRPRQAIDPDTIVVKPKGPSGHGRPRPAAGAPTPCPECGESPCGCVEGAEIAVAPGDSDFEEDDEGDIPGQVTLKSGDSGPEVEAWQTVCNEILLGDDESEFGDPDGLILVVDGHYGPATRQTTQAVQYVLGLDTSGDVDQATWHAVLGG